MNQILEQYDILVAGGGLVGATFAAALATSPAAQNLRIGVLERQPSVSDVQSQVNLAVNGQTRRRALFDPRVVALTEASRRLLETAKIWTESVAERACPYHHMVVRDSEGTGIIEFDASEVHRPDLGHIVENAVIVASAHQRLHALDNVDFIFQTISALNRSSDGETVVVSLADGRQLTAPLLVAADGAQSMVREFCGFQVRAWDYGHSAIITTIDTEKPNESSAYQWFTAHGPLAFLPLRTPGGNQHYSSIVWSQDAEIAEQLMAAPDDVFMEQLSRASEFRLGTVVGVCKRYCIPLRQAHTVDYVMPGVALIGDAAHTIHPLAGQGVNLGFADAKALVDEIIRGVQRKLPVGEQSTLLRYQRRRKPDNLAMMAAMEGFKRLFSEGNPVVRILRNRGMSEINALRLLKNQLIRQAMGF